MAYKIQVEIKIVETPDRPAEFTLDKLDSGAVKIIANESGESIDGIERAVVDTSYDAMRQALSKHLAELSKKKALKKSQ